MKLTEKKLLSRFCGSDGGIWILMKVFKEDNFCFYLKLNNCHSCFAIQIDDSEIAVLQNEFH